MNVLIRFVEYLPVILLVMPAAWANIGLPDPIPPSGHCPSLLENSMVESRSEIRPEPIEENRTKNQEKKDKDGEALEAKTEKPFDFDLRMEKLGQTHRRASEILSIRDRFKQKYRPLADYVDQIAHRVFAAEFYPELLKNRPIQPIFMVGPPGMGKTTMVKEIVEALGLNHKYEQVEIPIGAESLTVDSILRFAEPEGQAGAGVQGVVLYDELGNLETPDGTLYKQNHGIPTYETQPDAPSDIAILEQLTPETRDNFALDQFQAQQQRKHLHRHVTEKADSVFWQLMGNGSLYGSGRPGATRRGRPAGCG